MHHERLWTAAGAALAALAVFPSAAVPQQGGVLRYTPTVGQRAHILWWVDTDATIRDAAGTGDSILLEIRAQQSVTQQVLAVEGSIRTLEVTFDSARPRVRPAGGAWTPADLPFGSGSTVRLRVDDRYRVLAVDTVLRDSVPFSAQRALRAFATGFELAFPEGPVTAGRPWTADVVYPLVRPPGLHEEPVLTGRLEEVYELVARTTVVLDSLVARGPDSLAFLTVQGSFMPGAGAAPEAGAGETTIRGAFAGSLVWSSGWSAFVSGGVRMRATVTMVERSISQAGEPEAGSPGIVLTLDTTGRFQVRR